jgi:effector-binding domain-containing protein
MAKNVNTATPIKVEQRPEVSYMGIRFTAPFQGMFKQIDIVQKELTRWFKAQGITPAGPALLRYHVIDMRGEMHLEYGIPTETPLLGDERVKPSSLPAGRYASLIYTGSGLQGNKALIEGARAQGLEFDRWDTEQGDNFRCRYEAFLTDPKVEPRKTKWDIEVAIRLKDT